MDAKAGRRKTDTTLVDRWAQHLYAALTVVPPLTVDRIDVAAGLTIGLAVMAGLTALRARDGTAQRHGESESRRA